MQSFVEKEFVIWKKSMERGPLLSATSGSNKGLKTPGQIELNVNFTYNKVSINCSPLSYAWGCMREVVLLMKVFLSCVRAQ